MSAEVSVTLREDRIRKQRDEARIEVEQLKVVARKQFAQIAKHIKLTADNSLAWGQVCDKSAKHIADLHGGIERLERHNGKMIMALSFILAHSNDGDLPMTTDDIQAVIDYCEVGGA